MASRTGRLPKRGGSGVATPPIRSNPEPDDGPEKPDLGPPGTNPPNVEDVPGQPAPDDTIDIDMVQPSEVAPPDLAELNAELRADPEAKPAPTIDVSVYLTEPMEAPSKLGPKGATAQRDRVSGAVRGFARAISNRPGIEVLGELTTVPNLFLRVDEQSLEWLSKHPRVASIEMITPLTSQLDSSTKVIRSDQANWFGTTGSGFEGSPFGRYEIAIVDGGIRRDHQAFSGRIVEEMCYSIDGRCPNGGTAQFGRGAAEACKGVPWCDEHGTHVSGIAAGEAFAGNSAGVAPGAGIIAVRVGTSWIDVLNGLEHILWMIESGRPIAAVNMSLGNQYLYSGYCDNVFPAWQNLFSQFLDRGVPVVVAAGNDGALGSTNMPACVSASLTVSNSTDDDYVSWSTNYSRATDIWAPGENIWSAGSTSSTAVKRMSGTSMAAPHVAGAIALMRECIGNGVGLVNGYNAISSVLSAGPWIRLGGVSRHRLDVLTAMRRTVNNDAFGSPEILTGDGPFDDYDFNTCATSQPGEPSTAGGRKPRASLWWAWTPATSGVAIISTDDGGGHATTFDTRLSVFTGSSLGNLRAIAHDDDGGAGYRSKVTINVTAGTTYRIRVDGYNGQTGELNLHIQRGTTPTCHGYPATIVGTNGADKITGTPGRDVIVALGGDDVVDGRGGNDVICLGPGADVAYGRAGRDLIDGGPGNDRIQGGSGNDTIYGGQGRDRIDGNGGDDILYGGGSDGAVADSDDTINGGRGNDFIDGGAGDDMLNGGAGVDTIYGGEGIDTVRFDLLGSAVRVNLQTGVAFGQGKDRISEVENVIGTKKDDVIRGSYAQNQLDGRAGNDSIYGLAGDDFLIGGPGRDFLDGGTGYDLCRGGTGNDTHTGCEILSGFP